MTDPNEDKTDLEMMLEPSCWPNNVPKTTDKPAGGLLPLKRPVGNDWPALGTLLARQLEDDSWYYVFTPGATMFEFPSKESAALSITGLTGVCHLLVQAGWVVD